LFIAGGTIHQQNCVFLYITHKHKETASKSESAIRVKQEKILLTTQTEKAASQNFFLFF
jgi:ABC-type thiamine transport system ATPase subunit